MRIVFMGSPAFAVPSLRAVHASGHEITAVVTQPDRPSGRKLKIHPPAVKVTALELGLRVLQPETTRNPDFAAELAALRPDLLIVVAYGEILRKNLLDLAPRGAINLHASLLPKYRGAAPVAWAILSGETETGATTMLISERMDAGGILLQSRCPVDLEDTTETLSARISDLGAPLLNKTIDLWQANGIIPQQQDETVVTYAPKLKKQDGLIDWSKPADYISRQIRAFRPWPGSYSHLNGVLVKLQRAHSAGEVIAMEPGFIFRLTEDSILIACGGNTVLQVWELQPQNRHVLPAADFIHGYRCAAGQRFLS
jgi:methionyl-tRNA formyltransferase